MPKTLPQRVEKAKMIAKMIEIVTKETMSRHFYAAGDTVRKQAEGRTIRLQLTGAIARLAVGGWKIIRESENCRD